MASYDADVETFLNGTKSLTSISADFQFVSSFSIPLFPDQTSVESQKFQLCQSDTTAVVSQGTSVFSYASNKGKTQEQQQIGKLSLSRALDEYIAHLSEFKGLLPASTDVDDTVSYANLRFSIEKTIEDAQSVKNLLPAACPI